MFTVGGWLSIVTCVEVGGLAAPYSEIAKTESVLMVLVCSGALLLRRDA